MHTFDIPHDGWHQESKVKNVFFHHFSVTDPPKIQYGCRKFAKNMLRAKR